MSCLEQQNLESKALIPNVMKPTSKNRRKERSTTYKSASSRWKPPLNYINEQFLDDRDEETFFLDIGVHGAAI